MSIDRAEIITWILLMSAVLTVFVSSTCDEQPDTTL
jgi:hypothetical protein